MRLPAKLSHRSAIHTRVVLGAGSVWTLPQIQGEVDPQIQDQEPPVLETLRGSQELPKFTPPTSPWICGEVQNDPAPKNTLLRMADL